jgi:hypothetical protein
MITKLVASLVVAAAAPVQGPVVQLSGDLEGRIVALSNVRDALDVG